LNNHFKFSGHGFGPRYFYKRRSFHSQPVPNVTGLVVFISGFLLLMLGLLKTKSFKPKEFICPKCHNVIEASENIRINCSQCDVKTFWNWAKQWQGCV